MASPGWSASDIPDLDGATAIVTGGNSGIGFEAAKELAEHGARVVLATRDTGKGVAAATAIGHGVEVRRLDLADLASIRDFATSWSGDIELLIDNAGVMAPPLSRTADGFELQFGTNHLGHFALTNLLLPHVTGRVVSVSSGAHYAGSIDFDDPNWRTRPYRRWRAYGQSKLANLLFIQELQRRLTAHGSKVLATAAHPGWAATNLQSRSGNPVMNAGMAVANRLFAQSAAGGALPTLYAAVADVPGGSYAGPSERGGSRGAPTLVDRSDAAKDKVTAQRLWEMSSELTGTAYPGDRQR